MKPVTTIPVVFLEQGDRLATLYGPATFVEISTTRYPGWHTLVYLVDGETAERELGISSSDRIDFTVVADLLHPIGGKP